MELADQHIDEFISLYQKHFGVELNREDALIKGIQLLRLVALTNSLDVNLNGYEPKQ